MSNQSIDLIFVLYTCIASYICGLLYPALYRSLYLFTMWRIVGNSLNGGSRAAGKGLHLSDWTADVSFVRRTCAVPSRVVFVVVTVTHFRRGPGFARWTYGWRYRCAADTSPTSLIVRLLVLHWPRSVPVYHTGHKGVRARCTPCSCWCLTGLVSWRVRAVAWCGR
jgi:hypothetical protein